MLTSRTWHARTRTRKTCDDKDKDKDLTHKDYDKDKDKDKDLTHKDQDKDKDFTYTYFLQVAAKPTIAIKQSITLNK